MPDIVHSETIKAQFNRASEIAALYAAFPQAEAVVLAGSQTAGLADITPDDIDLYVYFREPIPIQERYHIANTYGSRIEIGNNFDEPSDEWIDDQLGVGIDVTFRDTQWVEDRLINLLQHHKASLGCTTFIWHNVLSSLVFFDRESWFQQLQAYANQPYPAGLRNAIIAKNYPRMRHTISSYTHSIELAIERQDHVSINHRISALVASYFDILFAVNLLPHPGEKRLIKNAIARCSLLSDHIEEQMEELLKASGTIDPQILVLVHALIDNLDRFLDKTNLKPLARQSTNLV